MYIYILYMCIYILCIYIIYIYVYTYIIVYIYVYILWVKMFSEIIPVGKTIKRPSWFQSSQWIPKIIKWIPQSHV